MTDRNEALRLADELDYKWQRGLAPNDGETRQAAAILRQQAERIAELEGELRQMTNNAADLAVHSQEVEAERDQLRAEVERLRTNAERYEWLRDNLESEWAICEWQDDPDGLGYYRDARASHIVDAAIDAARTHKDTP